MRQNVQIELQASDRLNLALLQNQIPIIKAIHITNNNDVTIEDLKIEIKTDPEQAVVGSATISQIRANETYVLENPDITHSWSFFKEVSEKIVGRLNVELYDNAQERNICYML